MSLLLQDVPEQIETPRLLLRAPRPGDGPVVTRSVLESLPELKQWMPWASDAYDQAAGEEWCRRCAARFITREELQFCLFTRDGQHAGNVGAFRFDWAVPSCEIGYWLHTKLYGQGLMTEAVNALVDMLVTQLKMVRIQIRCHERNHRSGRVAERCGFQLDGILRSDSRANGELHNTRLYSRIENLT